VAGTGGSNPLAPTIQVGGSQSAQSHARLGLIAAPGEYSWTCPIEGDPEPTDLNVPIRRAGIAGMAQRSASGLGIDG
jgi:hypothetical protein